MRAIRIACWLTLIIFFTPSYARVIPVGKSFANKTINGAIALAHSGDIVEVHEGVYQENVIVPKSIILRGIHSPSIDARLRGNVVLVTANNVTVEGFTLKNSGRSSLQEYCGIRAVGCQGVVIRKNNVLNNSIGINLRKCSHSIVSENNVNTSITYIPILGNAIHCWSCNTLSVYRNNVKRHRDGIYFEFVNQSKIFGNRVSDCIRYGLHFMFSHHNRYSYNVFKHNGAGVAVMYSHQVDMIANLFEWNVSDISYGLLLKDIYQGNISNNVFLKNSVAIYMDDTHDMKMNNNDFRQNGMGIRLLASSYDNRLSANNFLGNTFDVTTNSSSVDNVFDGNYWDKYPGYDIDKNGKGDVPYHPLSMFAMVTEQNPMAMLFFHSIVTNLLDLAEMIMPSMTPSDFVDEHPSMKQIIR